LFYLNFKILTFCAVGRAVAVPSIALQTDFSKHSMKATKFLVYLRLFHFPSVCLIFVSSFYVDIEYTQDFIQPTIYKKYYYW